MINIADAPRCRFAETPQLSRDRSPSTNRRWHSCAGDCLGLEYFCFEGDHLWESSDPDPLARERIVARLRVGRVHEIELARPIPAGTVASALLAASMSFAQKSHVKITAEQAIAKGLMFAGNPDTVYRQILEHRLRYRGEDSDEVIKRRLADAARRDNFRPAGWRRS